MKKGDLVWGIERRLTVSPALSGSSLYNSEYVPALGLYVDDSATKSGHKSPILLINEEVKVHVWPIFNTEAEASEYITDTLSSEFTKSKTLLNRYGKHRVKTEYYGTVKIDCNITEETRNDTQDNSTGTATGIQR